MCQGISTSLYSKYGWGESWATLFNTGRESGYKIISRKKRSRKIVNAEQGYKTGSSIIRVARKEKQNRGGVIYLLQFVCVCVCVCLSARLCLWKKFQPNEWTDLDVFFAKWLLSALAQTLLKLVTSGHRNKYPFFLHNSLLTSLLCIKALLC